MNDIEEFKAKDAAIAELLNMLATKTKVPAQTITDLATFLKRKPFPPKTKHLTIGSRYGQEITSWNTQAQSIACDLVEANLGDHKNNDKATCGKYTDMVTTTMTPDERITAFKNLLKKAPWYKDSGVTSVAYTRELKDWGGRFAGAVCGHFPQASRSI